jgi:hypothetical protein
MENCSHISGNPDAKGDARCDDEVVTPEHEKTPAVTEIAVRTESELPQAAPAGTRTASTFCKLPPVCVSNRKRRVNTRIITHSFTFVFISIAL